MRFTSQRSARPWAAHGQAMAVFILAAVAGCARSPQTEDIRPGNVPLGSGGAGQGGMMGLPGTGGLPGGSGGSGMAGNAPEPAGGAGGSDLPGTGGGQPDPDPTPKNDAGPSDTSSPVDTSVPDDTAPTPDADREPPPPPPPPAPEAPNLARGRVAHWRLDETTGKTAGDTCGVGNHGNIIGGMTSDWRAGRINNGLLFTPSRRTSIEVQAHETLRPPRMLSISLWVRAQSWSNRPRLVQKGGDDEQFGLTVEDGKLRFSVRLLGGRLALVTAPAPALNQWVHVAALFDGWKAQLFVGGTLAATSEILGYPQPTEELLYIGGRPNAPEGDHYAGMLDDIIVYTRPLSPEEIRLAASGRTP